MSPTAQARQTTTYLIGSHPSNDLADLKALRAAKLPRMPGMLAKRGGPFPVQASRVHWLLTRSISRGVLTLSYTAQGTDSPMASKTCFNGLGEPPASPVPRCQAVSMPGKHP
jgi:hypothetical protein